MRISSTAWLLGASLVVALPSSHKGNKRDLPLDSSTNDRNPPSFGKPQFYDTPVREDNYAQAVTIPITMMDVFAKRGEDSDAVVASKSRHSLLPDSLGRSQSPPPGLTSGMDLHRDAQFVKDPDLKKGHRPHAENPFVWDFESFSQDNFIGNRQRFNGDGCFNFHCSEIRSFKGLPDKEYIFYQLADCTSRVLLRTGLPEIQSIPADLRPFQPCSIRVQYPSNWNGWGTPPNGADLAIYSLPWYSGPSLTIASGEPVETCHGLDGRPVMSYRGHERWKYAFYSGDNCTGEVLVQHVGPDSRPDNYMAPLSVRF
ncbi:hypothetical protein BGW38_004556 [Lunasporangiospora selenospora]|uniref:Uncharacterized protein n=1 Tax=Lunasporangiospora selenospora TaxID=979761 RepID=A0A9P6FPZ3_9FUNG|nr:hypothetical protein BGW38_004556 [Lunasporangiospora selenospora]